MNNKEFISILAGRTEKKTSETQKMVESLIAVMSDCFQEGDSVRRATACRWPISAILK